MAAQEMNLRETVECIKFSVEASKQGIKLPLMIFGEHGIGKTQTVYQFAEENNYNVVVLHLATQDIADLIGIPREKNGVTIWTEPEWLANAKKKSEETGKPNLFFLDEFSRGHRMVLAAMLPFLIEGKLHTHTIGINDAVIAAANPPTENYDVQDINDEALLDRLGHIIYRPTSKEYIDYMVNAGHSQVTINLIKKNPEWAKIRQFELPFDVVPSRRSIDYVMTEIEKKPKKWIESIGPKIIEAYLGSAFMEEWMNEYFNQDDCITLDMIMDYGANKDRITQILKTEIDGVVTTRLDILQKATEIVKNWIEENKETISRKDIDWMKGFFSNEMVPGDTIASVFMANEVIKDKVKYDGEFNKEIVNFLREKKIINNNYSDITPW